MKRTEKWIIKRLFEADYFPILPFRKYEINKNEHQLMMHLKDKFKGAHLFLAGQPNGTIGITFNEKELDYLEMLFDVGEESLEK